MNNIFQTKVGSYNLSYQGDFIRPNVNCEHFGISFVRYMAAKVWIMVSNDIKNINNTKSFKSHIRKWEPANRHCRLCLDYVSCVGYVNTF